MNIAYYLINQKSTINTFDINVADPYGRSVVNGNDLAHSTTIELSWMCESKECVNHVLYLLFYKYSEVGKVWKHNITFLFTERHLMERNFQIEFKLKQCAKWETEAVRESEKGWII